MSILTNLKVPGTQGDANGYLLMPKLQNRFRVTFTNLAGGSEFITGNVKTVTRPTLSFDPITLDAYNSRVYIPGKHTWNPITLVFRDDVTNNGVLALNSQITRQIDMASQATPLAAQSFKFAMKIELLNGGNGNLEQLQPFEVERWDLAGCYIENVEYGNNDYSTAETIDISVTIKYDNAKHTPNTSIGTVIGATGGDETTS